MLFAPQLCLMAVVAVGAQPPFVPPSVPVTERVQHDETQPFLDAVHADLDAYRFAELDRTAVELRHSKARFRGGDWKLYRFYGALGRLRGGAGELSDRSRAQEDSDQRWKNHIARLQRWRDERPESAAAAIALAEAFIGYAWQARGGGYSDTVSPESWERFDARLADALRVMSSAPASVEDDPQFYVTMIDLVRGLGWERPTVDRLVEEAVAREPLYQYTYSAAAFYLTPRWHGQPGDWERFADQAARGVGGVEGSIIYSHIASRISAIYGANEFFNQTRVPWQRIKQGFIDRENLYGASRQTLNAFGEMAGAFRDKATARELFERIGDDWDENVWRERKYFEAYRNWVMGEPAAATSPR